MKSVPSSGVTPEGSAASAVSTPSSAPPASNSESSEPRPLTTGLDIPAGNGLVTRGAPVGLSANSGEVADKAATGSARTGVGPELASTDMVLRIQRLAGGHLGIHLVSGGQ